MKTITSFGAFTAACFLLFNTANAQGNRAFNQNSSRSNNTRGMSVYFSPVFSSPMGKAEDSLLFRGNGAGLKFGGDYFFNAFGFGVVSGFQTANADENRVNDFIHQSGLPTDGLQITKASQQNMYLLLGPSLRWGKAVQLYAHAKGGLFINNGGLVNIQQKGAQRALYRNETTAKSFFPGFQSGLGVQYSNKAETWSLGFSADYLNTKTQVQNFDIRRGGSIEGLKLTRNVSDLLAGITFRYTILSPRDHASGQATGKRTVLSPRDVASGLPTGRRMTETVTEEITIDEGGVHRMNTAAGNCGPVTQRVTNPDGTTEEITFACPADAAAYEAMRTGDMPNRISMNVTVPKQTQGATFGEKVNQRLMGPRMSTNTRVGKQTQGTTFGEKVNAGLHAAGSVISQGAGRTIISGTVSVVSASSTGIITNQQSVSSVSSLAGSGSGAAAASYAATGRMADGGTQLILYTRETGSGMATGKRSREAGSGMATGRRQYQPVLNEGAGGCDTCAITAKLSSVKNNPLYSDKGTKGNNPLYNGRAAGPDNDCDGIAGLDVLLTDARTGVILASTKTAACGNFFFANVPDGDYAVKISGSYATRKDYDITVNKETDLGGQLVNGNAALQVQLALTETDSTIDNPGTIQAILKSKTKSNQSNDRTAAPATGEDEIWSPRSNKLIPVGTGDLDGDGSPDLVCGNAATRETLKKYFEKGDKPTEQQRLVGGALPGGAVVSAMMRPGSPIGGISIKGGKNPGGNLQSRTTNETGEFEFTGLDAGNYTFTVEQQLFINDETPVSTRVQDHNSSRSNKSSSSIAPNPGSGEKLTASKGDVKVTASQNSQSLRTISVQADLDGDGTYESDVTDKVTDEVLLDKDGNVSAPQQKAGISTSRSNIRNKTALQPVTQTVYTVSGTAIINGREVPVIAVYKVVEKATSGLKDTLKTQV